MSLNKSLPNNSDDNNSFSSDNIQKPIRKKSNIINLHKKKLILPNISSHNKVLREIYNNKKIHRPIYIFTEAQKKIQKPKVLKKNQTKKSYMKVYELEKNKREDTQDFNVFNSQDKIIKDLVQQFNDKVNKKKLGKLNRRKNALNKLYEIPPEFNNNMNEAKKFKSLDLEDYQKNILSSIPSQSMEQGGMMDLVQNLNSLRNECNSVKPLPPINIKIIEDHVLKQNNSKSVKKMKLKEFLEQSNEPKDDYEREQRIIKNLRSFRILPKFKRNKNYDFLPLHLRESLRKNLKLHL